MYLGTNASRSGTINIGSSSSVINNIGAAGSTVDLAGTVMLSTVSSPLSQTNGTVYMTVNTTITYDSVYNELNIINAGTATRSLYLPSTIKNYTFWITTLTNSLIIGVVGESKFINFGCDSTDYLTIQAGSTVCIVACVGSDSYNLIYSNSQMYKPMILYSDLTAYAPTSIQSGYTTFFSTVTFTRAAANLSSGTGNISSTALPKGIYYISIYLFATASNTTINGLNLLTLFGGCVTTASDQSTVVNNMGATTLRTGLFDTASSVFATLTTSGYYNNSTTGTILRAMSKSDGAVVNLSGYTVRIEFTIKRIY